MNKAFEKILERLDELREKDVCDYLDCDVCLYNKKCGVETDQSDNLKWDKAIEIVREVAEGYNNGWIPVSERLPEEGEDVLVWYEYFRYGNFNCMWQTYGIGYHYDGHWSGDVTGTNAKCIAWMPLPECYKE